MKLATHNVNGINGRLDVLLRWLAEAKPDVVCLQELKPPEQKFPHHEIERAGYGAIWHGQKSWNGVAILARDQEPRETRRGLLGDPDDSHSRYIEAALVGDFNVMPTDLDVYTRRSGGSTTRCFVRRSEPHMLATPVLPAARASALLYPQKPA